MDEIEGIAIPIIDDFDADEYEGKLSTIKEYAKKNNIPLTEYETDEDDDLTALNRMTAVNEFAASFSLQQQRRQVKGEVDKYKEFLESQIREVARENGKL